MNESSSAPLKKVLKNKNIILIILFAAAGILLVFASGSSEEKSENLPSLSQGFDEKQYIEALETKLEELLLEMSGINHAQVMITLASGPVYAYVKNTDESVSQNSSDKKDEVVFVSKSSSVKEPISETVYSPKVSGAAVVCTAGGNAAVQAKVIGIVSSVLDLSANRIFVTD